jgi:hypothetical protein
MTRNGLRYDGDLEMFCEAPKAINVAHLRFLRWLIEHGRLEHLPAGPPSGVLVQADAAPPLPEAA